MEPNIYAVDGESVEFARYSAASGRRDASTGRVAPRVPRHEHDWPVSVAHRLPMGHFDAHEALDACACNTRAPSSETPACARFFDTSVTQFSMEAKRFALSTLFFTLEDANASNFRLILPRHTDMSDFRRATRTRHFPDLDQPPRQCTSTPAQARANESQIKA